MQTIALELDKAHQNLLDLTLRNRLLNYRLSKMRSIRVVDEVPAEIYDALVLREKSLDFRGKGLPTSASPAESLIETEEADSSEWEPLESEGLQPQHTDRFFADTVRS